MARRAVTPPHALFVFLDGVGLGPGTGRNPFAALDLPAFERLAGGQRWTDAAGPVQTDAHVFVPLDATLGVPGLPQSGTGQAALFSGENAAAVHGGHFGPYPPSAVRPLVEAQSVFARLLRAGVPVADLAFANAYPDRFFTAAEARGRWTTTTFMARAAGVRLRTEEDLARGEALTADITGEGWQRLLDPALPVVTEAAAARRLHALARRRRLTLFEYFLTDKAGHSRDPARAADVLHSVDRFFQSLLGLLDPARDLLVVTSDHGNLEDLSTKSHTTNPVPLAATGRGAGRLARAASLLDVTPLLVDALAGPDG
jgi:2,3-bisphosphoglycerate-independent phosphoglycerate mutase